MTSYIDFLLFISEYQSFIGSLLLFENTYIMFRNELLDFEKWKNFMFDQWLTICWDIIEMAATMHFSKITQMFATL